MKNIFRIFLTVIIICNANRTLFRICKMGHIIHFLFILDYVSFLNVFTISIGDLCIPYGFK